MICDCPWLDCEKNRWSPPETELHCEVAIVGGGISGVATLYYLLENTDKHVVLLEKERIASGATGHNAGLAVAHIEAPTSEITKRIGEEATNALFEELDDAWVELHEIHEKIGLGDQLIDFSKVANGFCSIAQLLYFIEDRRIRTDYEPSQWSHLVSENLKHVVPEEYHPIIEFVPHSSVLAMLNTVDTSYVAAAEFSNAFKIKRMNSANFCYRVLAYLQQQYPHRFFVYEQTDITKIDLFEEHSVLEHASGKVTAGEVILCTNGYKHFSIWDQVRHCPVTKVQEGISPRIGFLAAYPKISSESYAMAFAMKDKNAPVWYVSQAPHPNNNPNHACVIGGPEFDLYDDYSPEWEEEKREQSLELIQEFLGQTYQHPPEELAYFWHGLMGYSRDGLRWVGVDSDHPHLWYNLACNGIGIVPAIAGAKKIASEFQTKND